MLLYVVMLRHARQSSVLNRQIKRTSIFTYVTLITVQKDPYNSAHLRRKWRRSSVYQRRQ